MVDWIKIRALARVTKLDSGKESPATTDELGGIGNQIAADAVYGSFGEFLAKYWDGKLSAKPEDLANAEITPEDDSKVRITLNINSSQYEMGSGGLQHFLGVLAGDLFFPRIPGFTIADLHVTDVEIPKSSIASLENHFRKEAHTTERIRAAFGLGFSEPLLAFSIKPRVGLKKEAVREIVLGVLDAGFHVAEFDTRYLDVTKDNLKFLFELAIEAAKIGGSKRITRLSPNISIASTSATEIYNAFKDTSGWPCVVKVDGGFDGISTIQALRKTFTGTESPIITCYPLLREQLNSRIPRDLFIRALALSGADIVYPGFSPSVGGGTRELGTAEKTAISSATERYANFVKSGWPLVTLAGGVYAGQLHCLYELVGPEVGFFLGGAVSLHKDGPIKGADLCVRVMKSAVKLHAKDPKQISDLSGNLIKEVEAAYERPPGASEDTFSYFSPSDFLSQVKVPRW